MTGLVLRWAAILLTTGCATAQDFAAIDRVIEANLPRLSGGAVLLLDVGGQTAYAKAYGRFTLNTAVPIASATKWISGAVLMAAVDEGKLSLDDRAGRWLPEFATGPKAAITVRQLFSHTSGLPGGDGGCLGDARSTLEACIQEVSRLPLIYAPGSAFFYGGNSMQVAGRIVEIATGMGFTNYYRRKLAGPLGFADCSYNSETNPRIAGGLTCTAGDYLKFLRMVRDGGVFSGRQVLSRFAVDEMLHDQTGGVPILYSPFENYRALLPTLPEPRYGIGEWMEVQSGTEALEISSPGAFGTCPWIDPRRDLAGIFLTSGLLEDQFPVYWAVKEELRKALPAAPRSVSPLLNAASYAAGPVAPGMIFTLFGKGLGPGALAGTRVENGALTKSAAGTRVLFNGVPAPMIFSSAQQLAGIVPYSLAGQTEVSVVVESAGVRSPAQQIRVAGTAPGIFDTGLREVRQGSIITLWATGEGVLVPPQPDGAVAGVPPPLPRAPVALRINGAPADVLYAGASPGSVVGLLQINARVPDGVNGPARFDLTIGP